MNKLSTSLLILIFVPLWSFGQSITLDSCQAKARNNYPLLKQYGLIEKTSGFSLSNANKAYLPQLSLSAKATYQSDVTKIPESLSTAISGMTGQPFSFPEMPKDQYQAVLEIDQLIWDGGLTAAQKKGINASTEADKQKLEVDLYALKDRINNLYFGIMLIKEQIKQNDILKSELATNYNRIQAYIQNGVAQSSDLDAIEVEQINATQNETNLKATLRSYTQILAAFTGEKIDENTQLVKPELPEIALNSENKRPELLLFGAQEEALNAQRSAINAGNLPRIGLFAQGGYGRPALNMFSAEFSPFYIGGVRLSWNISGFYTRGNNLSKIETSIKNLEVQKETFLFNSDMSNKQQYNDIDKLKTTLQNDDKIISLRNNIKKASEAKVANGTLSVADLIRDINNENMSRQTKALHEIQLYMTTYQLKNNLNN